MAYYLTAAPSNLDTDGVRSYTEGELVAVSRAMAETELSVAGRLAALETWKTAMDTLPVVDVKLNTQQTVPNSTFTKVLFDTVTFDSASGWDATNKRYLPTRAGYYRFSWSMWASGSGGLTSCLSVLYKNGAASVYGTHYAGATGASAGSGLVLLNGTTDYVEIFAYVGATTPIVGITGTPNVVTLQGEWVRP